MGKLVVLMITAFIDMVGTLMIIPLLPFYAKNFGANGLVVGLARVVVLDRAAAQRADVGALLRSLRTASGADRRHDGVGDRVRDLRLREFALAALPVAARAGIGRRHGERHSGVRRRRGEARRTRKGLGWLSAATNAGVALGPVLGSHIARHSGPHAPGLAAAALCVLNIIFALKFLRRVARHGRSAVECP